MSHADLCGVPLCVAGAREREGDGPELSEVLPRGERRELPGALGLFPDSRVEGPDLVFRSTGFGHHEECNPDAGSNFSWHWWEVSEWIRGRYPKHSWLAL